MKITLPDGVFSSNFIFFNNSDKPMLKKMFKLWVQLCRQSLKIGSTRIINFPEGLSEAIFCIEAGARVARSTDPIPGTSSSFDCFDFNNSERIQLKAASSYGPSSFGPRSEYDRIFFLFMRDIAKSANHIARNFSGYYEIYELNPSAIPLINVNKTTTLAGQQQKNLRPRFIIPSKIIEPYKIKPIYIGNIDNW